MQRMSLLTIGQSTLGDEARSTDELLQASRSPTKTDKSIGDFNARSAWNMSQDNSEKRLRPLSNDQTKTIKDISDSVNMTRVPTYRQNVMSPTGSKTVDKIPDWLSQNANNISLLETHSNITLGDYMTERAWQMQRDPSCRQRVSPSSNQSQMPLTEDVTDRNNWKVQRNSSADRTQVLLPRNQSTFGSNTSESHNIPLANSLPGEQKTSPNGMPRRVSCEGDIRSRAGWSLPRPKSSPSRMPSSSSGDAPGWGVLNSSPKMSQVSTKSIKSGDSIWSSNGPSSTKVMNGKLFDGDFRWAECSSLNWQYQDSSPSKMAQKSLNSQYGPVGWGLPRACSSPNRTSPDKICSPPTELLQSSLLNEINTTKPITDDASKSCSSSKSHGNSSPTERQQVNSSSIKPQSEFSVKSAYDVWCLPRASSPTKANSSPSVTCAGGTSEVTSTWGMPQRSLFSDKLESSWSMPVGSSASRTGSFYGGNTTSEGTTMWGVTNSSPAQGHLAKSDLKGLGVSQTSPKMQRYNSSPLINSDVNDSSGWMTRDKMPRVSTPPDSTLTSIKVHSRVTNEDSTSEVTTSEVNTRQGMPRARSPTDPISRYSPLEAATYYSLLGDETSESATYWRISRACTPPGMMSRVDSSPGATSRSNSHSEVASNTSVNTQSAKSLGTSRPNLHSGPRVKSPQTTSQSGAASNDAKSMGQTSPHSTNTPKAFVSQLNAEATAWSLPQKKFGSLQDSVSNLNQRSSQRDLEVKSVPGMPRASTSPMRGLRPSIQHRIAPVQSNFPLCLNGVACSSLLVNARIDINSVNVSNIQNSTNRPLLNLQEPQITPHVLKEHNNIRDPGSIDASNRTSLTSTNRPQMISQDPQATPHVTKEHNTTKETNYIEAPKTSLTSPIRPQMNPEFNWSIQRMNQYRMQQMNAGLINIHTFHTEYGFVPPIPLYRLPQMNSSANRLPNMNLYNIGAGDVANSWGLPRMTQSTVQGSMLGRGTAGWGVPRANQPWGKQ